MPQRKNIVGDLGTTKVASDSYDIDNIYLTEEGWVYRHYKRTDNSKWWDEIIVAGEVPSTDSPQATNPPKLGKVTDVEITEGTGFEGGDTHKDYEYSSHQVTGAPGTYSTKVVAVGGGVPNLDTDGDGSGDSQPDVPDNGGGGGDAGGDGGGGEAAQQPDLGNLDG